MHGWFKLMKCFCAIENNLQTIKIRSYENNFLSSCGLVTIGDGLRNNSRQPAVAAGSGAAGVPDRQQRTGGVCSKQPAVAAGSGAAGVL